MNYSQLKIGQKIYYTGDMANLPAQGAIVAVCSNDFYPVLYDVELNNGEEIRISKNITPAQFQPFPGRRFILMEEYEKERKEKIEALEQHMKTF